MSINSEGFDELEKQSIRKKPANNQVESQDEDDQDSVVNFDYKSKTKFDTPMPMSETSRRGLEDSKKKIFRPKGLKQTLKERYKPPIADEDTNDSNERKYTSRRDDVAGQNDTDSEGDGETLDVNSGIITIKDTQGNITNLKPHDRFIRFKNSFLNLTK